MDTNRKALDIADLISRDRNNELTEQETKELRKWIAASPQNYKLYQTLMQEQDALQDELDFLAEVNVEAAWQKVAAFTGQPVQTKIIPFWQKMQVWRNVAAVLFILGLAGAFYHFKFNKTATIDAPIIAANLVEKSADRPVLILHDGSRIDLDSMHTGTLSNINGVKVISEDGMLRIDASALAKPTNAEVAYNTIVTPHGIRYQVVLPDGSKVWLNAASSLRFPTAFAGTTRQVELTGEAYFEVVKDKKQFIVNTNTLAVTVLGTSFNVSAYDDDNDVATTLVTGHVQVSGGHLEGITNLTPGRRAVYSKVGRNIKVSDVDAEQFIVWKEGKLYFEEEELASIMAKLSRWYNLEVRYLDNGSKHKTFTGVAYTDKSIDHLLNMIRQTTDVTIEKKENKLIIQQK